MSRQTEREIREIAIAANSGEASDEQIVRLDELIRSDRQLANYAARLLEQQASLAWQGLTGSRTSLTRESDLQERSEASSIRERSFKRKVGRGPGRRLPSALDLYWAGSRRRRCIAGTRNQRSNRSQCWSFPQL